MIAPCSVKAKGRWGENLRLDRWSQIVTTSSFSFCGVCVEKNSLETFQFPPPPLLTIFIVLYRLHAFLAAESRFALPAFPAEYMLTPRRKAQIASLKEQASPLRSAPLEAKNKQIRVRLNILTFTLTNT
jgi:hypothetical protein